MNSRPEQTEEEGSPPQFMILLSLTMDIQPLGPKQLDIEPLGPKQLDIQSPGRVKNFSLLHVIQTGSGAHPASYPMARGVKRPVRETDHLQIMSRSRKCGSIIHSPIRLHYAVLN
jgi:hypothetical protein